MIYMTFVWNYVTALLSCKNDGVKIWNVRIIHYYNFWSFWRLTRVGLRTYEWEKIDYICRANNIFMISLLKLAIFW